jgi:hypothetical protein
MKRVVRFISIIFFLFLSTVYFNSCSDSEPIITSVSDTVIFEFNNETSAPQMRLSLFTSVDQIQRVRELRAVNETTGLTWTIDSMRLIAGKNNKYWAGYTNLVAASGSTLPTGKYTITYEDAAERECETAFSISYPKEFADKKAADFPAAIKTAYVENVAIYAADGTLLYFGKKRENWSSDKMIKMDYALADNKRVCYSIYNNTVVCMMPAKKFENTSGGSSVTVSSQEQTESSTKQE